MQTKGIPRRHLIEAMWDNAMDVSWDSKNQLTFDADTAYEYVVNFENREQPGSLCGRKFTTDLRPDIVDDTEYNQNSLMSLQQVVDLLRVNYGYEEGDNTPGSWNLDRT